MHAALAVLPVLPETNGQETFPTGGLACFMNGRGEGLRRHLTVLEPVKTTRTDLRLSFSARRQNSVHYRSFTGQPSPADRRIPAIPVNYGSLRISLPTSSCA